MRIYNIISKKRDKMELSKEEIDYFINSYVNGEIADYQASALLMAIFLNGMTDKETADLTIAMTNSGDIMDLSEIKSIKVDKHSTGGVGDKTTLIVAPIVAACGGIVAKLSGRGLGHTGGTLDKLESLPGFSTSLSKEQFIQGVKKNNICIAGQTGNIAPADKKLYALRDVTATVNSIPLIASSIMSKKLASGAEKIILDVKTGSGAFMKTLDDSVLLAQKMVSIGTLAGKDVIALVTNMDTPLGSNLGNSLEVIEAVNILKGEKAENLKDLYDVSISLAANMLVLSNIAKDENDGKEMAQNAIYSGEALEKFCQMVDHQGSSRRYVFNTDLIKKAKNIIEITSPQNGYISHINTELMGLCCVMAGAGREKKDDKIDYDAGIILNKKTGDYIEKNNILLTLHTNKTDKADIEKITSTLLNCYNFSNNSVEQQKPILAKIDKSGVIYY